MEWFKQAYGNVVAFFRDFSVGKYVNKVKSISIIDFARNIRHWVQRNKNNVLIGSVVIFVAVIGLIVWNAGNVKKDAEANRYLATAFNFYNKAISGRDSAEQQKQDMTQALNVLQDAVRLYPASASYPECLFYLGNIFYITGDYTSAMNRYQQYIKRFPKKYLAPFAQESIGYCYEQLGDVENATKQYELVKTKYPKSSIAGRSGLNVARCYENKNDYKKAFEIYQSVMAYAPNSQWARAAQIRVTYLEARFQFMQSSMNK